MYRIAKRLTRFKLVVKKHVYGGFKKVIIKEGLRAKEGLVCLSSKFSLLKPNNLVSMTRIFTCVLFAKLVRYFCINNEHFLPPNIRSLRTFDNVHWVQKINVPNFHWARTHVH